MNSADIREELRKRGWEQRSYLDSPNRPKDYSLHPKRKLVLYIPQIQNNTISILDNKDDNKCATVYADKFEMTDSLIYAYLGDVRVLAIDIG